LEYDLAVDILTAQRHWLRDLAAQMTVEEVLALVREFAAHQQPVLWAQLTKAEAAPEFSRSDDVAAYAVALMHHEFRLTGDAASHYYEIVAFFAAAANRLAVLAAPNVARHPFFSRDAYLSSEAEP
jgi:hypothetical protein